MASQAEVKRLEGLVVKAREDAYVVAEKMGKQRLNALMQRATADLALRLSQAEGLGGAGADSFTAAQLRVTMAQIQDVTKTVVRGVRSTLLAQGKDASEQAVGNTVEYLARANRAFTGIAEQVLPIKTAALFDQVSEGVNASILRRLASSGEPIEGADEFPSPAKMGILERYGVNTLGKFEEQLQLGLATRKPWAEIRDNLTGESEFLQGAPGFWAERIVRTETMGAYNRAGWETIRAADKELGDMVKILSATFDDRTGWDSYQVHGQIRLPDEAFEWADGAYQHPPNRPNDRETVVPHRIAWPIPPYLTPKDDDQVEARYRMFSKKGPGPGERPEMTTVPLARFGKG